MKFEWRGAWVVIGILISGLSHSASINVFRSPLEKGVEADEGFPLFISEDVELPAELRELRFREVQSSPRKPREGRAGTEVRTLVHQGPVSNRIDLTILGDGYTAAEKEKFFQDCERISRGLFEGQTFASYLPLFNVHAVFVPSQDSGITDLTRKNTAFGLYRTPAGSKRAIMPGNTGALEEALELAPDTDYPIVIANDDFYGGLGGRYAISTRSEESGLIVLRHELGHNFGNVGEEYDGGQVYTGANFSRSADAPWKHWAQKTMKAQEGLYLSGAYAWHPLKSGPYTSQFDFPQGGSQGPYSLQLRISSVGWATPDDVEVFLDGTPTRLMGRYTIDRSFFGLERDRTLAPGRHRLEFREKISDGDNVLAFAEVFALPADYDRESQSVQAFATFTRPGSRTGYRPTHESCLMRDMRTPDFCVVDQENMWRQFYRKIKLVDSLEIQTIHPRAESQKLSARLMTPALSHLQIRWSVLNSSGQSTALSAWNDQNAIELSAQELPPEASILVAVVQHRSPEIREFQVIQRVEQPIGGAFRNR